MTEHYCPYCEDTCIHPDDPTGQADCGYCGGSFAWRQREEWMGSRRPGAAGGAGRNDSSARGLSPDNPPLPESLEAMMATVERVQIGEHVLYRGCALTVLPTLPDQSINCCVTSPPYFGLRDYGVDGQIGLEQTPAEYVAKMVAVFREVRRVLRDDGTLWLNLGDSYAQSTSRNRNGFGQIASPCKVAVHRLDNQRSTVGGSIKPKDLLGIPWRVAFALQADGWYLRQDIIWHKPNPMPESVTDRCTKAHEYLFLLAKSARYYYDAAAIAEATVRPGDVQTFAGEKGRNYTPDVDDSNFRNGHHQYGRTVTAGDTRNRRSVWTITTQPYSEAHFATFPPKLIEPCILAGCPKGGVVLDPFLGSGTTVAVAAQHWRNGVGIELNPAYLALARNRIGEAELAGTMFDATKPEMASLFEEPT